MELAALLPILGLLFIVVALVSVILFVLTRPRVGSTPAKSYRGLRVISRAFKRFGQLWFVFAALALLNAVLLLVTAVFSFSGWLIWFLLTATGIFNPLFFINFNLWFAFLGGILHLMIGGAFYGIGAYIQVQIDQADYLRGIASILKRESSTR